MSYGYSQSLVAANRQASARSLGVTLGRACIRAGVSVYEVAEHIGVSRMTIYNWFSGSTQPHPKYIGTITEYLHILKRYPT